jgi:hypothetical protein
MIIIKTNLRKIPNKCKSCKFSCVEYVGFHDSVRMCSITGKEVPYVFNKDKRNWEYTKAPNCPLRKGGADNER